MTFAELDQIAGIPEPDPSSPDEAFPLPTWYREVRNTPIDKLSLFDICRACGQDIHIAYVVPVALKMLGQDPLAGAYFDGHLLTSMFRIPSTYWAANREQASRLNEIVQDAMGQLDSDEQTLGRLTFFSHVLRDALANT